MEGKSASREGSILVPASACVTQSNRHRDRCRADVATLGKQKLLARTIDKEKSRASPAAAATRRDEVFL